MIKYEDKSNEEVRQMVADAYGPEFRKESDDVAKELLSESPRASVLVGAAWLDDYLSQFIALTLPPDEITQKVFLGTVRSFGQRITAAHNLGIIGKREKEAMDLIRKIRNAFAHKTSVSFNRSEVESLAASLKPYLPGTYSPDPNPADESRSMYVALVSYHVAALASRSKYARHMGEIEVRLDFLRFAAAKSD